MNPDRIALLTKRKKPLEAFSKTIFVHAILLPKPPLIMRFCSILRWVAQPIPFFTHSHSHEKPAFHYDIRRINELSKITPNICKSLPFSSRYSHGRYSSCWWHCRHFERTSNRWKSSAQNRSSHHYRKND